MSDDPELTREFDRAAEAIRTAEALLIGAGAGMGVDSGLPDFRGPEGFWQAYPVFRGQQFAEISTPHWFRSDPALAWGFFGHRLNLYRDTAPHAGFQILRRWGDTRPLGCFVFTSNVDGHFHRAGFPEEQILECHGSIHYLQCADGCQASIWPAAGLVVDVDESTIRCRSEPPACPRCAAIARPNILMFGDFEWLRARYDEQRHRYDRWLRRLAGRRVVAVELGAGRAIPTVRWECERHGWPVIRINLREADVPRRGIAIPCRALDALRRIDAILAEPSTGP